MMAGLLGSGMRRIGGRLRFGAARISQRKRRREQTTAKSRQFPALSSHIQTFPPESGRSTAAHIISRKPGSRQFRWCRELLRKRSGEKNRAVVPPGAALSYQKHHILPTLQRGLNAIEIVRAVDLLFVYLKDHVSAREPDIVGK